MNALPDDLDGIKRGTDMVALWGKYGVTLKQRGQEYDHLCQWHDEPPRRAGAGGRARARAGEPSARECGHAR